MTDEQLKVLRTLARIDAVGRLQPWQEKMLVLTLILLMTVGSIAFSIVIYGVYVR